MVYVIYERETGEIHWELSNKINVLRLCNNKVFGYQPKERG